MDWDEYRRIALGELGMSEQEFYDTTLRAITLKAEGHRRAIERQEQVAWERARWLAAVLVQPYVPKGKRLKTTDLAVFPWETPGGRKELTEREIALLKKWDAN